MNLRGEFLLDPEVTYLNHGSFGACPRPVFQEYQEWQLRMEREPVDFFVREVQGPFGHERSGPLEEARESLAKYVGANSRDLYFTPNVTVALNQMARSVELEPGDEVLTTDHEYGTVLAAWRSVCEQWRARLVLHPINLPVTSHADWIESFWSSITPRTRVILLSHITSASALILPVAEICRRAREAGILTVIDGAHAVGQVDLAMEELGADFYTSNCHKWLCCPKGSAFAWVHPEIQAGLKPLVISWAQVNDQSFSLRNEMWGTRDLAAFLSVPAALRFYADRDWGTVRRNCHQLLLESRRQLHELFGTEPIAPEGDGWFRQMASIPLPESLEPGPLWHRLRVEYGIEAQPTRVGRKTFLRLSIQGYNTRDDIQRLLSALEELMQTNREDDP